MIAMSSCTILAEGILPRVVLLPLASSVTPDYIMRGLTRCSAKEVDSNSHSRACGVSPVRAVSGQ